MSSTTNRTKASRLYSQLVQGVKTQLAIANGNGNGPSTNAKKDKHDYSLYTTSFTSFLVAAEDVGRKRLDASFRLSQGGNLIHSVLNLLLTLLYHLSILLLLSRPLTTNHTIHF